MADGQDKMTGQFVVRVPLDSEKPGGDSVTGLSRSRVASYLRECADNLDAGGMSGRAKHANGDLKFSWDWNTDA